MRGSCIIAGADMTYDPDIHHRRSIRLKGYDYAGNGAYFITLCTYGRSCCFEHFPRLKRIVEEEWYCIPNRFPNVVLDEYVIMPNHFHGILFIDDCRDTPCGYPDIDQKQCNSRKRNRLGEIIGAFKSLCAVSWLGIIESENVNARAKFWQQNYFEHVIRSEKELDSIRRYIKENPIKWEFDKENPMSGKISSENDSEEWMV